jgi:hypothetical protein
MLPCAESKHFICLFPLYLKTSDILCCFYNQCVCRTFNLSGGISHIYVAFCVRFVNNQLIKLSIEVGAK